jgi:putative ABC transport system substrate-binding protein
MFGLRRREFLTFLGSAAAWPIATHGQQPQRMRRIGVLVGGLTTDDSEWQARGTAFVQELAHLGWTDGGNLRIDYRWGGPSFDLDRLRKSALELLALTPDAMLAGGAPAVAALQTATRTLPIVFANVVDPVGRGFVASLARPGANITGFMSIEFGLSAKWLELLKQIAPNVKRVAVFRNNIANSIGQFGALQVVASSLGVELVPIVGQDVGEIERQVIAFARGSDAGLIVSSAGITQPIRELIITLAASHRMPAVYPFRGFVTEGGLISYGIVQAEAYRLAAGYVDRILKGEKPADLPVQGPTKYELVINLKTARALGIDVPRAVRARADEVIE